MMDEMNDNVNMERLERLLSHPETVAAGELDEWLADKEFRALYATAMDVRRAELGKNARPDVRSEYRQFRRWVMRTPAATEQTPPRHRVARLVPWVIAAAAVLLALFVMTFKHEEKVVAKQGGIMVYSAANELNDVALIIGPDTFNLGKKSGARAATLRGLTVSDNKELSYNPGKRTNNDNITHTLALPYGKTFQLTLSDGSRVWLNADSKIKYPDTFSGSTRTVELEGEAYFEVTHDEEHPFMVKTGKYTTTVLGTEFNVRQYENESPRITLVSGKVSVKADGQEVVLLPGQNAMVSPGGQILASDIDVETVICWREGEFYFDNMQLKDIMPEIGRWYKMDVIFKHPTHLNDKLHFHAERNWPVGDIIKQLNIIGNTKMHIENNSIIVE